MNKLLLLVFVLSIGCDVAEFEIEEEERMSKEERHDELRKQFPEYDYYLDLFDDGVWELVKKEDLSEERGGVDWAERSLRNTENTYKIPDGAPYEFNINTGLRFIK